jgi:DNA-binding response OmpR family regulator
MIVSVSNTAINPLGRDGSSTLILIVDNDASLTATLSHQLRDNGFDVLLEADGLAGLHTAEVWHPDVVVLEVTLPKIDGLEVCRRLRLKSDVPILMLTSRGDEEDCVVALDLGADDYVTKPLGARELTARLRALLRRAGARGATNGGEKIIVGPLEIDPRARTVRRGARAILMKPREFDLLYFLAKHPDQVFTRAQLLESVWGSPHFLAGRTVDVHMYELREKIEENPSRPQHLVTMRRVGYKFAS